MAACTLRGPTMSACRSPPDRSTSTDLARSLAVAALAVIQIVVAGLGGSGALGEDVGTVARSYPTPVLPAGWTFAHLGR